MGADMMDFPTKTYRVILADPPWRTPDSGCMRFKKFGRQISPLNEKYPLMDFEEIKALRVPDLAEEDCGLFLWVTQTALPWGLEIMTSWNFRYHLTITWDKGHGYSLWGFNRDTELCLFGWKGKLKNVVKLTGEYMRTIIRAKPGKHSVKPTRFYTMIEKQTYPPRLELFAREKRVGWDTWGNEVPCTEQQVLSSRLGEN
jgi:N6-adenosine-specific RNA methylase IME4